MTENLKNNKQDFANTNEQHAGANPTPQKNTNNIDIKKFEAYGGFWRRLASNTLDIWPTLIALIFVNIYLFMTVGLVPIMMARGDPLTMLGLALAPLIILLVVYLINTGFNIYFYFKNGETLGYKILGMKIISEKNGEKPTAGKLWGRFGMKFLFFALMIIPFVNILALIFYVVWAIMLGADKRKQGLHEKPVKTLVVMEKVKRTWLVWVFNLFSLIFLSGILAAILFLAIDPQKQMEEKYNAKIESEIEQYENYKKQ